MANKNATFSYIKNVGKSFGYAFVDVMRTNNPVLSSLAQEAKDTTSSIYQMVKDFKLGASDNEKSLVDDSKNAVKSLWKNLTDDLKSGNWYNKERNKEAENALVKAMGVDFSDFDMDFNFDDDDWGDDVSNGEAAQISQDIKNTTATIIAMDDTGERVANAVSAATVSSANYVVQASKKMNLALYDLNKRGFNQVTEALLTVNTTTAKFADAIGKPLTTHINNSQIFFTNVTQSLNNIEKHLMQIEKNTTSAPLAANHKYGTHNGVGSIVTTEGGISISAYKDMLKKNIGIYKDLFGMVTSGVKNTGGINAIAKTISPMQFALTNLITLLIPRVMTESMKKLNESTSALLSAMLTKGGSSSGSLLGSILSGILVPDKGMKKDLSTSAYNKGAVAWDGIARKALIEVIPTTLFKIYSAISGAPMMTYDYEKGKFIAARDVMKNRREDMKRAAQSAGGDFRNDLLEGQSSSLKYEIDAYFLHAFVTGKPEEMKGYDKHGKEFTLSKAAQKLIRDKIKQDSGKRTDRGDILYNYKYNNYPTELAIARESYSNNRYREEASGHSVENVLYNGNKDIVGNKFFVQDYQAKVVYYLEGIYKNTWYGGGSGSSVGGRVGAPPMFKSNQSSTSVSAGEKTKAEANKGLKKTKQERANEQIKKLNEEFEKMGEDVKEKKNKISDKISNFMGRHFPFMTALLRKPIDAFAGFVQKFTDGINEFLWGDKGIFDFVKSKFSPQIDKVKKFFGDLWEDEEGNGIKQSFQNIGSSLGGTAKRILGIHSKPTAEIPEEVAGETAPTPNYRGRQVTKTGIVAVSEGEMIIPSEFNPYFKGRTNKKEQMRRENQVIRRFYGAYDKGTTGVGTGRESETKSNKSSSKSDDAAASDEPYGFFDYVKMFGSNVSNKFAAKKNEIMNKDFSKAISDALSKSGIKKAKGNMGAGFLIGATAGGYLGSPIMGALLGTTIGYITKSESAQNFLFGRINEETGEREGGFLPKEWTNFIKKHIPSMAKGAGLGFIGGAFMGSPVLGAIAGSAIGYVASSNKAKEFLFGKDLVDENGNVTGRKEGIISKKVQDAVKKAAPNMAAGALGGLILGGPFGFAGNMALGAGLGFVASSDKFHKFFFGDGKDKEGLLKKIQKKVLGNITELFMNVGNRLRYIGDRWLHAGTSLIKNLFGGIKKWLQGGKDGKHGFLGKLLGGTASFAVSAIGAPLKRASRLVKRRNLRQGMDVFDKEEGRNLFASERIGLRKTYGGFTGEFGRANRMDQALANISTTEELQQLEKDMAGARRGDVDAIERLQEWSEANKLKLFDEEGNIKTNRLLDAQKLLKTESKDTRFKSPELVTAEKTEEATVDIKTTARNILNFLLGKPQEDKDGKVVTTAEEAKEDGVKGALNAANEDLYNKVGTISKIGADGKVRQYVEGKDGEIKPDTRDKETSDAMKTQEALENAQIETPGLIKSMTSKVGGFFGKLGNSLFGTDKEPTKLGRVMNFIKENFLLVLGGVTLIKKFFTSDQFRNAIISAGKGIWNWIKGIGDNAAKALTNGGYGEASKEFVDPNSVEGTYVDDYGVTRYIDTDEVVAVKQDVDSFGTRVKKTILEAPFRGATGARSVKALGKLGVFTAKHLPIVGKGVRKLSGVSKAIKKGFRQGVAGQTLKKNAKWYTKLAAKFGAAADDKLAKIAPKIMEKAADSDAVSGLVKIFKKIPFFKKYFTSEAMEGAAKELVEETAKKAGKAAIFSAVKWATIVFTAAADFLTGWQDARTTFKITRDPSIGQRLVSGLLRLFKNNLIPLGTLIPDSVLIDIFIKVFGKTGFLNADEIKKAREEDQAELDEYNKEHGTDYTIQEYNKNVLHDYTTGEKIGNWWKGLWNKDQREQNRAIDLEKKFSNLTGYKFASKDNTDQAKLLYNKYWNAYYSIFMSKNVKGEKAITNAIKDDLKAFKKGTEVNNQTYEYTGGASGLISQYDPRYSGMTIGGNSFASKGCGPAVAAMAAQAAGKSMSVQDAVNLSRPYQNSNGVSADYFTSALGSRGISTSYSTDPNQIARSIAGGGNTILLGSDPSNGSKALSPFGPNSHYVLATGTDRNGNVIIRDPESNGIRSYNPNILRSAKLGIFTGGAGVLPDTPIAQQVWSFFRQQGFSPAATAGIMGNLYQESGMKPDIVQKGSGHAAGIAQWESYKNKSGRWLNMANFAASRGKDWTDLDSQLNFILQELSATGMQKRIAGETAKSNIDKMNAISGWNIPYGITYDQFKNTDDLRVSTGLFEAAFERAGKPNMEGRYNNALDYYNKYSGGQYDKVYAPSTAGTIEASNTNGGEAMTENNKSLNGILSSILGAFGSVFTGRKMNQSFEASSDGTGITADPKGFDFSGASQPIDYMKAIERKIDYSMKGPRDPDKGSADCSSTVRWAIQKAGGPNIGGNTSSQYNSKFLDTVWYNNANYMQEIPNEMKPNDIIFFQRPNGDWAQNHPDKVGHVGLYLGNGEYIHHPGGKGPKIEKLPLGNKGQILKVSRVKASGAGSGLRPARFIGGASAIANIQNQSTTMLNNMASNIRRAGENGQMSPELVQQLLMAIIEILQSIANNTVPVGQIYQTLVGGGSKLNNSSKPAKSTTASSNNITNVVNEDISSSFKNVVSQLAAIAKG